MMRKVAFFHFRGNSERRVHVFLRHLEKMSHQFFEPEMGLSAHFQQKRPKRPKKIFRQREEKSISCPGGTRNGIFLPLLLIRAGQEMDFSSRCLKNVYFSFLYMKILFGPFLSFSAFFGLCWPFSGLFNCQTFTRRGNYL